VGTSIASNLSYAVEKRLGIKRKTYNKNGDIKSLVAAETANNSTGFTSMMPLLLLGLPITTSEAILLSLIDANSFDINYTTTLDVGMFETLVFYFVLVNIVCFTISWPMVQYVNYLKKVKLSTILSITMLTIFALVCYNGHIEQSMYYFVGITLVLLPVGYLLRKTDPLIVVIAFVLQDRILESGIAFYQINF
jgi:TctA family transporter